MTRSCPPRVPAAPAPPAPRLRHRCAVRGADAGRPFSREGEETPSFPGSPDPGDPHPHSEAGSFPPKEPSETWRRVWIREKKRANGNLNFRVELENPVSGD